VADWNKRDAARQGIAVAVIAGLLLAGALYLQHRPQGPDVLKAEVSTLRSLAAEAELVLGAAPQMNGRFLHAHAGQLANKIERAHDAIADLNVESSLRDGQRFAANEAQRLDSVMRAAMQGDVQSQRTVPRIITGELQVLEHSLQR